MSGGELSQGFLLGLYVKIAGFRYCFNDETFYIGKFTATRSGPMPERYAVSAYLTCSHITLDRHIPYLF